jgi:hypothetical protein
MVDVYVNENRIMKPIEIVLSREARRLKDDIVSTYVNVTMNPHL